MRLLSEPAYFNPAPFGFNNNSNHTVTLKVTNSAGQTNTITRNNV